MFSPPSSLRLPVLSLFWLALAQTIAAQAPPAADAPQASPVQPPPDKRVLGILPNYRTANYTADYHPITSKQKITIALKDTFDYPLAGIGAIYASFYQLEDSHPQFGQGVEGYLKRFGTSYTDQLVGNMMTEGILPIAFHEDPRYFRLGSGKTSHRLYYSISRILVTRTDSGGTSFNFAEVLGNGIAAGVGLSYYSDDREVKDYLQNWGTQLATDTLSQVLKEFWPDIKRKYFHRRPKQTFQSPLALPVTGAVARVSQ
jgi:hypothetical protein